MKRLIPPLSFAVLLGLALPGCSGVSTTGDIEACGRALQLAGQELDNARNKGLAGSIPWIKAANLLSAANNRMQDGNAEECPEDVRRARLFIREAEK